MTIDYQPSDFNEVTVVLRWRGTIFPAVLGRPVIYLLMLAHLTLLYLHLYHPEIGGGEAGLPKLPGKALALPNGLLTFFLVFYSGNCYARYYALYAKCTGMAGCIMSWVGHLCVYFPEASQDTLWNLSRYMVASVYVLYFQLAGSGSAGGAGITKGEWSVLRNYNMISESERVALAEYRGFKPFLLQCWAMAAINEHLATKAPRTAGAALGPFQAQALALRGHCAEIINTIAQPVPFPYYHIVSLMLSVNLIMVAWQMTEFSTVMTIPAYFIICLITLGLKETAVALSDPFGGDDVDFDTDTFMAGILNSTKAMISTGAQYKSSSLCFPAPPAPGLSTTGNATDKTPLKRGDYNA